MKKRNLFKNILKWTIIIFLLVNLIIFIVSIVVTKNILSTDINDTSFVEVIEENQTVR